jgi:predicted nucleic acid-binding protein
LLVIDASAVAALLLKGPRAAHLRERLQGETLYAPHLLDLEVAHVLRRAVRRGALSDAAAISRLADLTRLPLERYAHHPFLERIWQLRANLSAYDAAYVALAEALDAPLITLDARLGRAPGHRAQVEVYGEEA